jgi:hypothetical protein
LATGFHEGANTKAKKLTKKGKEKVWLSSGTQTRDGSDANGSLANAQSSFGAPSFCQSAGLDCSAMVLYSTLSALTRLLEQEY